jgi:hypothetical protein
MGHKNKGKMKRTEIPKTEFFAMKRKLGLP